VGSVKRVTDIVGEIASAAGEQSIGIDQVNRAMTQMDQVTQSNSAQNAELSSTAQALSEQSVRLLQLVGTFDLGSRSEPSRAGRGHQPSSQGHRPVAGTAHRAKDKVGASAPNGRRQLAHTGALAGGPADRSEDASFEEF
jgi:hypothetical protein